MLVVALLRRMIEASLPLLVVALFLLSSNVAVAHSRVGSPHAAAVTVSSRAPCASAVSLGQQAKPQEARCAPVENEGIHHDRTGCCSGVMTGCCLAALTVSSPALVVDRGVVFFTSPLSASWSSAALASNFRPPIIF